MVTKTVEYGSVYLGSLVLAGLYTALSVAASALVMRKQEYK